MEVTLRDEIVDFIKIWSSKMGLSVNYFLTRLDLNASRYYEWVKRYHRANGCGAKVPKSHWLLAWEKTAIIEFYHGQETCGYRRLTYMMLDQNIVAVSPSSVYRVLLQAKLIDKKDVKNSQKGTGFKQPKKAHAHWHVDISYINICGTFYYLCSLLDGYSRFIVGYDLRESMVESDIEIIIQKALEKYPDVKPRIISDNGPQFIANDFKEFIRYTQITHVKTSPYYPQSNGKIERWHKSLKGECIRIKTPISIHDAKRCIDEYVEHYNTVRLHSAIGYVTPQDKLNGNDKKIFQERKIKLAHAKQERIKCHRQDDLKISTQEENDLLALDAK